jgi:GH24 family phage-related lysozyme (muramidase)
LTTPQLYEDLKGDVQEIENELDEKVLGWRNFDDCRQDALVELALYFTVDGLLAWKAFMKALNQKNYKKASGVLRLTVEEHGHRIEDLANMIYFGTREGTT